MSTQTRYGDNAEFEEIACAIERNQRKLAELYRARAITALHKAREALAQGRVLAARGLIDEANFWHAGSNDWTLRAEVSAALHGASL